MACCGRAWDSSSFSGVSFSTSRAALPSLTVPCATPYSRIPAERAALAHLFNRLWFTQASVPALL